MGDLATGVVGAFAVAFRASVATYFGFLQYKSFDDDAAQLITKYAAQKARLELWGAEVGLIINSVDYSVDTVQAYVHVDEERIFSHEHDVKVATLTLNNILSKFKDLDALLKKLTPSSVDDLDLSASSGPSSTQSASQNDGTPSPGPLRRADTDEEILAIRLRNSWEITKERNAGLSKSTHKIRAKLVLGRWKKEFYTCLAELTSAIDNLEGHLLTRRLGTAIRMMSMRALAGVTDDDQLHDLIKNGLSISPRVVIDACNRLSGLSFSRKAQRKSIEIQAQWDCTVRHQVLSGDKIIEEDDSRHCKRSVATGNEGRYLIDWKAITKGLSESELNESRTGFDNLIKLLTDSSIHGVLSASKEIFEITEQNHIPARMWFGIAYKFPDFADPEEEPVTLEELLSTRNSLLPLGDRFHLARCLSTTVLEFHAALWLHQSLRSSNVLFFTSKDTSEEERDIPYICGFEYARALGKKSEERASGVLAADMYQHPYRRTNSVDEVNNFSRYRREYDIYSLGCILYELGRWKTLKAVHEKVNKKLGPCPSINEWTKRLDDLSDDLGGHTGTIYANVVRWCLGFSTGSPMSDPRKFIKPGDILEGKAAKEEKVLTEEFYNHVVLELRKCRA